MSATPSASKVSKHAFCHPVGDHASQQGPHQLLAHRDDSPIEVGIFGPQERDHRGQLLRSAHPHFDIKARPQQRIESIQRGALGLGERLFDGVN